MGWDVASSSEVRAGPRHCRSQACIVGGSEGDAISGVDERSWRRCVSRALGDNGQGPWTTIVEGRRISKSTETPGIRSILSIRSKRGIRIRCISHRQQDFAFCFDLSGISETKTDISLGTKYHVANSDNEGQGLGPHKYSSGCLTFLYPVGSARGLEVLDKSESCIPADLIAGTFVVNFGNAFEAVTEGAVRATIHRVQAPTQKDRYSIPFFMGLL